MRILFVTYTNIGDAVLSTALLRRLLEDYPEAIVDVVVGPKAAPLFEGMPQLGILYPMVKKKRHGHYIDLWKKLKDIDYDILVDLRTPFLSKFLKAKKKIVYKSHDNAHKAEQLAALWPKEGAEVALQCWVPERYRKEVSKQFAPYGTDIGPVIAIAPTANWVGKRWPQRGFANLIRMTEADYGQTKTPPMYLVLGAEHERPEIADFLDTLPKTRTFDLVGKTNLAEALAWLSFCDVFVGNDSGLGHMAAACGKPCISLFGPTNEKIYAPTGGGHVIITPDARPLDETNLDSDANLRLITDISPQQVYTWLSPRLESWYQK